MLYPWPFLGFDALFDDALRIAMDWRATFRRQSADLDPFLGSGAACAF
jgi:hypothetical protein